MSSPHQHLVGTTVKHGNLVGKVISVSEDTILISGGAGSVVAVTIPTHLRGA